MTQPPLLRFAAVAAVAISLTSCKAAEAPQGVVSVEEIVPRIDELDGETVSVAGYLSDCLGYECRLYRNKQESDEYDRAFSAINRNERVSIPDYPVVGIGTGPDFEFDAKAAPFTHSYVVITGTITNDCRYNGQPACTDRSTDLIPSAIRALNQPSA
jgi:hypothetical protein